MGTVYNVRLTRLPGGFELAEVAALVDAELLQVNAAMSTYDPQSELSRFNTQASTEWFRVSRSLASIVAEAQRIAELSEGAFDITAGPLVDLWGFGPERGRQAPPAESELKAARAQVGHHLLLVRTDPPALKKQQGDLRADLSAIAKGHGVDRVALRLEDLGIRNYLVEIGGEVRALGRRADGKPWQIGVERPGGQGQAVRQILPLTGGALATSGDYRNFFSNAGRRYSHIIDPRNGQPIAHALAAVTVFAPDCASADAWATALSVLGPEAGLALAEQLQLAAMFVLRDGENFTDLRSRAFDSAFAEH